MKWHPDKWVAGTPAQKVTAIAQFHKTNEAMDLIKKARGFHGGGWDIVQRKSKKTRKHQGVNQTGGNKGRLRKGYRYSGKKLKSGLPQIIKCKSKKC